MLLSVVYALGIVLEHDNIEFVKYCNVTEDNIVIVKKLFEGISKDKDNMKDYKYKFFDIVDGKLKDYLNITTHKIGLTKDKKNILKSLVEIASSPKIDFNKIRDEWKYEDNCEWDIIGEVFAEAINRKKLSPSQVKDIISKIKLELKSTNDNTYIPATNEAVIKAMNECIEKYGEAMKKLADSDTKAIKALDKAYDELYGEESKIVLKKLYKERNSYGK